jgi:hypothetical protein
LPNDTLIKILLVNYGPKLISQIDPSRWDIKEKAEMRPFFDFVFHENDTGNISRQELVSMIPVLLLVGSVDIPQNVF